jgi:nucleoside-diphosphate-sugar epimerase
LSSQGPIRRAPVPVAELDGVLAGREGTWKSLKGARILLTGGTGFVGTWMLELLCRADHVFGLGAHVLVLTRQPDAFERRSPHLACAPCVELIEGDVREFPKTERALTHVVHGATDSHGSVAASNPSEQLEIIVEGTRRVLDAAVSSKAARFLLISSGAVYGPQPPNMTTVEETFWGGPDPMSLKTAYGQGKRMAEHLCVHFASRNKMEVMAARGFAFVGPHLPLDAHFAIGNFIRDGLSGGPVLVHGDGTPVRSYLYASEMASWLWGILAAGQTGRAYNVGSDQALQILDLAKMVAEHFETGIRILSKPVPGRLPERYVPSVDRIRLELGLSQAVGLREAIRRTVDWYRTYCSDPPGNQFERFPHEQDQGRPEVRR